MELYNRDNPPQIGVKSVENDLAFAWLPWENKSQLEELLESFF
jgi:hypothetical protein